MPTEDVIRTCKKIAYEFTSTSGTSSCTWSLRESSASAAGLARLRDSVVDLIVQTRCPEYFLAWRERIANRTPHDTATSSGLLAFLRPVFGTEENPLPPDHIQASVAAVIWFAISVAEAGTTQQFFASEPQFEISDPGGDGLTLHASPGQTPAWWFRLWEIKKAAGSKKVAATARGAAEQLVSHGAEYLARFKKANESHGDPDVRRIHSHLVEHWVSRTDNAGAGVSVSASTGMGGNRSFQSIGRKLTGFSSPAHLLGEANSFPDLPMFAQGVAARLWRGL